MTKLKTHDLIRLRQIDRKKFEKVIREYANHFGKLKDDERKRKFEKDPNAEQIYEFISKLFRLTIKITEEEEVLRRWFANAKSKNYIKEDTESLQEMKVHLLKLSFEEKNNIIKETDYFGDLDIAEKLLDIENKAKNTESTLAEFKDMVNGRLEEIDKDINEKFEELKKDTSDKHEGLLKVIKNTESTLESFRDEVNGKLNEIGEKLEGLTKDTSGKLDEVDDKLEGLKKDTSDKHEGALKVYKEVSEKAKEGVVEAIKEEAKQKAKEIVNDIIEKIKGFVKPSEKEESKSPENLKEEPKK